MSVEQLLSKAGVKVKPMSKTELDWFRSTRKAKVIPPKPIQPSRTFLLKYGGF